MAKGSRRTAAFPKAPLPPNASPAHLPSRNCGPEATQLQAQRIEEQMERYAPGFRDLIVARHVAGPAELEEANANLAGGAVNAGTAALHQQLVFRPVPGTGRPETPVPGLYLAGASAHPGGGVHGACGANAARAALLTDRPGGRVLASGLHGLNRRLSR